MKSQKIWNLKKENEFSEKKKSQKKKKNDKKIFSELENFRTQSMSGSSYCQCQTMSGSR